MFMSEVADDRADDSTEERGLPKSMVDRTLLILGTFQNRQRRQTLSEISRSTGLPIATCYRIVQRLTEWGALEKGEDGRYYIGLRLWEVAALAPQPSRLQRVARSRRLLRRYRSRSAPRSTNRACSRPASSSIRNGARGSIRCALPS